MKEGKQGKRNVGCGTAAQEHRQAAKRTRTQQGEPEGRDRGSRHGTPRKVQPVARESAPLKTRVGAGVILEPVSTSTPLADEQPLVPRAEVNATRPAAPAIATPDPLAMLTAEINDGWVDSLRLVKGAALRLIRTGERLQAARKLVRDDAEWQATVERKYAMAPHEAAALAHFACEYGTMTDRLSPAVAVGLAEVLVGLGDLYVGLVDPDSLGTGDTDGGGQHADTGGESGDRKNPKRQKPR